MVVTTVTATVHVIHFVIFVGSETTEVDWQGPLLRITRSLDSGLGPASHSQLVSQQVRNLLACSLGFWGVPIIVIVYCTPNPYSNY